MRKQKGLTIAYIIKCVEDDTLYEKADRVYVSDPKFLPRPRCAMQVDCFDLNENNQIIQSTKQEVLIERVFAGVDTNKVDGVSLDRYRVDCTCTEFRQKWNIPLIKHQAACVDRRKQIDANSAVQADPLPGVCKHILSALDYAEDLDNQPALNEPPT